MANPDILFRGIPRGPTRGYTARVLAQFRPERVVIPCTGSFSLAVVAREAGIPAEALVAGDISLYSTALGRAIMDEDWRLEVKDESGEIIKPYLTDPLSKAAAVLYTIRLLQYAQKADKIHHLDHYRELVVNLDVYVNLLKEQIGELRERLRGLRYQARDMWETLEDHRENPQAALLVNPPRYTGGYDRMFKGIDQVFDWDAPQAAQFVEKDYARLMELLGQSQALTLMYYATPQEDPSPLWGSPWRAVFADRPGSKRAAAINWIISNQTVVESAVTRSKIELGQAKFPLFTGEIRPDSNLRAVKVTKRVGDYYRDLFIHKLPGSFAERYVALLMDGYLMGVVGLHLSDLRRGHPSRRGEAVKGVSQPASVTFAFTVHHEAYKRLHKLTLMSVISSWFWNDVIGGEAWFAVSGAPCTVQTTMLTPHPENKTARGVLKMTKREKQPDGTYKLTYFADVEDRSSKETLQAWLNKYETLTR